MKELMRIYEKCSQVTVTTIDAYEGQEQEAIILITTRTSGASTFVADERRLASAISRPRDFIAVIGDLDYLEAGALWSKYLVASVKLTPPVDAAYVDLSPDDSSTRTASQTFNEPFGPLDFVSIDEWAGNESDEDLVSVDEWIDGETTDDALEVPAPTRKRQASRLSPQPGPSRRCRSRSRSPAAGPFNLVVTLVNERPSFVDTHAHPDLMKRKGIKASEWNLGGTKEVSFGGAIACFAYPALYMDNIRPMNGLSHYLRRYTLRQLLRDSSLIPRDALLGAQFGCHPRHASEWNDSDDENISSFYALRRIFEFPNVQPIRPLAIGETGLDTSDHTVPPFETQCRVFDDHIWVASEFGVPIVLHLRGPRDDDTSLEYVAMSRLAAGLHELGRNHKVHRHCFRHSVEMANQWRERFPNTKFGITGKLLGRPLMHEIEFARTYPLEHILLETDSPHLGPNPTHVIRVAEEIARLRGIDLRIVVQQTTRNAEEFYGITLQH